MNVHKNAPHPPSPIEVLLQNYDFDWPIGDLTIHYLPPHIAKPLAAALLEYISETIGEDELNNLNFGMISHDVEVRNDLKADLRKRFGIER